MQIHPEAVDLVDLARRGPDSEARSATHLHCMVCDDCHAVLTTVMQLRRAFARPTATLRQPAAVATMQ